MCRTITENSFVLGTRLPKHQSLSTLTPTLSLSRARGQIVLARKAVTLPSHGEPGTVAIQKSLSLISVCTLLDVLVILIL